MKEIDFHSKYKELKDIKSLKWSAFGDLLNMKSDAIRVAFDRKSLKEYEKNIIENYFDENKKNVSDDSDYVNYPHIFLVCG